MAARMFMPYRRRGTAGGYTYTATFGPGSNGWGWGGYRPPTGAVVIDFGPQVAGGGPFDVGEGAERAADEWFDNIPGIVETTGQHPNR